MNGKQLIKLMKKNGWVLDRKSGSHHIMIKERQRAVSIPVHGSKDLPKGLVAAIMKQANIRRT